MRRTYFLIVGLSMALLVLGAGIPYGSGGLYAARKKKAPAINPNDPTLKLYALLDNRYDGKLTEFYFLADVYKDPSHPGEEWQHVVRADYNKKLFFGRFRMNVRSISQPTPDQLKVYSVKALYGFGSDSLKFDKIDPGPFGGNGDLYMVAVGDKPLKSAPVTPDVRAEYEKIVTQYLIPALEKKNG